MTKWKVSVVGVFVTQPVVFVEAEMAIVTPAGALVLMNYHAHRTGMWQDIMVRSWAAGCWSECEASSEKAA